MISSTIFILTAFDLISIIIWHDFNFGFCFVFDLFCCQAAPSRPIWKGKNKISFYFVSWWS